MTTSRRRDSYAARIGGAAALAVLLAVVGALLGPDANPDGEWFEHTGFEGELQILDAIEVVQDEDPITAREARSMPRATQGVRSPITERVVNEENPNQVDLEQPPGQYTPDPMTERRVEPERRAELQEDAYVEMDRTAQTSDQFVLLHSVQPEYPPDAPPGLRTREVVVRVNMYVDETGHVTHAYVDRNDGGPLFEDAVLDAVTQWIYRPLEIDGEASGFWDTIYFVFRGGPATDPVRALERLRAG